MPKVPITLTDAQRKQLADERLAARRARRQLLQQRIVRSSEGWRIEEEQMGRKRRSPQEWATRAEAQTAIDAGYRVPAMRRIKNVPMLPMITDIEAYKNPWRSGRLCTWCKKQGIDTPASFGIDVRFDTNKKVTLPLCHPNAHNFFIGDKLNRAFDKE